MTIDNQIGRDPYHVAQTHWVNLKNLRGDSIKTGRISTEGNLGNWTGIQNVMLECIPLALHHISSAATHLLLYYLYRNILGRTRNEDGNPKTYIIYKPTIIMKKACIDTVSGFYRAKDILKEKKIIYFRENRLYLNIFPLTWNVEDEEDRIRIEKIMEKEIERINQKVRENNDSG